MNKQGINIPFWIKNYDLPIPALDYLSYVTDLASAWSTQRVVISGYFGDLVRLRRSSDNAESDFGYSTITGAIDNTAIDAWAGIDSVFYVKIYDQQGSNHYIQTTNTLQPERVNDRAFSNDDKMMVMTSTVSSQNITMMDRCEATTAAIGNRTNMADTLGSQPYRTFMLQLTNSYFNYYAGDDNGNNYYRIAKSETIPLDTITGVGFGGAVTNNLFGFNATLREDDTVITVGTPTGYYTTINIALFFKTATAYTYRGYIDERYHYTELLNSTNYGTVRTYLNDKYSVY